MFVLSYCMEENKEQPVYKIKMTKIMCRLYLVLHKFFNGLIFFMSLTETLTI